MLDRLKDAALYALAAPLIIAFVLAARLLRIELPHPDEIERAGRGWR